MTRCNRSEVNLKSTAYNQNGQNYFEQLTAYNSMSSHLRRILLAKCVVDAKNKNYIYKRKQSCKSIDYKPGCARTKITNDVIDRLAYDTLHHPAREDQKYITGYYNDDVICSESRLRNHVICPDTSIFKSNKLGSDISSSNENIKQRSFTRSSYNKIFKPINVKYPTKIKDYSENRFSDHSIVYQSASDFITQEVSRFSSTGSTSRSYENYENAQESANMTSNQRKCKQNEDIKYAKFVYDITREIMHKGLYTDKELQEVFKKHLEQNKHVLDKNKMLYEVYQLKVALNVSDDSDDEELEDLIRTQQLLNISEIRPPTPPKILNENKLYERLRSYGEENEVVQESKTARRKSVVLIDANPQLVITEEDVLTSLVEANIDPKQAQQIWKELFYKSKDALLPHQTKENRSYEYTRFHRNQSNSNSNKIDGREKSCTTSDLIMQENKNIQVE
ncbi:uncharacterized protein LOC100881033 isoform X2 [Megachile rotundata]|uniref:uncharacterized protein LOC100881033 isoform X2 n=1 Tax=Megachile rotundata TaxID=143995 RepID=UPI003FD37946